MPVDGEGKLQPALLSNIKQQISLVPEFVVSKAGNAHEKQDQKNGWLERRAADTYDQMLPAFEGVSFKERVAQLPPGSVWLDYGCGDAAVALQQVKQEHPDLVCEGVTYPVERDNLETPVGVTLTREDGDDFLVHHVGQYDLITCNQSLRYSPDQLATLKRAYRALKENGVLLVDFVANASMPLIDQAGNVVDPQELLKVLQKKGYHVEIKTLQDSWVKYFAYTFAIRRTSEKAMLKIPVRLVKVPEMTLSRIERFDTEFKLLGTELPGASYVYQLENGSLTSDSL